VLYPQVEPYARGTLDVGEDNVMYWEVCGNPAGRPAVVLHGGPGSGCTPGARRLFDPTVYRVVLFDQRGCGRSTPHASDPRTSLAANTTEHLLGDIERLREHLGVDRWLVFGGSWGCVLALAYAQRHRQRVTAMVLTGIATGRRTETELLTRGLGGLFPQAWARFRDGVPAADRDGDLTEAYHRLLHHPDPAVRTAAAQRWCQWETAIVPTSPPHPRYQDPDFRMAFARIVTHYWRHGSWLDEQPLLHRAHRLTGVPATLVQGTLDLGNLLGTPWQLTHAWPDSQLILIDNAGHNSATPTITDALTTATDHYAHHHSPAT
jgi:proline iminopeptidase